MEPAALATKTNGAMITITAAKFEDAQAIATLGSEVFTATFDTSVPPEDFATYIKASYTTPAWEKELLDPKSTVYVARSISEPANIVGFIQLRRDASTTCLSQIEREGLLMKLDRVYVASQVHGQGVGTALINYAFEQARAGGFVNMWLGVWEHHPKAAKLYGRLGFQKVGDYEFMVGKEVQVDWCMVKNL